MSVLSKAKRYDALEGRSLSDVLESLGSRLRGRVNTAFVFGSAATGRFTVGSDIDLVVVAETTRAFPDRFLDFQDLWEVVAALDLLVYTPQEFEQMDRENISPFWKSLRKERIRIC